MQSVLRTSTIITLAQIEEAANRIRPLAFETPIATSRWFDEQSGLQAFFKCENLQRGGAFKIRGAANFLAQLTAAERERGVVAFSSGNHAQAVAIAAVHYGTRATIVMPTDAPKAKLHSTQAYGPDIIFFDRLREDREKVAAQVAAETGAVVVPAFDHEWIMTGQGTAALEFLQKGPDLDALLVPLGGGGLLSGCVTVARALRPGLPVYGVEPELADDWHRSLQAGQRVAIDPPLTIADGLRAPSPGKLTFDIIRSGANGVLLVTEEEIKETVRFLLSRTKLVVEPSGAVAAAAVLFRKLPVPVARVGVILSGGNVDFSLLAAICEEAA